MGLRFICASCQHFMFEKEGGVSFMEDDCLVDPVEPSNVAAVEVVNLVEEDGEHEDFFQSLLRDGQDAGSFASPQLDNLSGGTFGEWDTSLVETNRDKQEDKAVSKRDYEFLLMTSRLSAMEDDQLKLPWESCIFKSIFDDDPTVSLLPAQVLSVPGDVLCIPSQVGASSSSVVPEPKQFSWLSRDVVLAYSHLCTKSLAGS